MPGLLYRRDGAEQGCQFVLADELLALALARADRQPKPSRQRGFVRTARRVLP